MKFISRSLLIMLVLYGLVFALIDAYLGKSGAPLWVALIFAVIFIGLQFLVAPYIVEWVLDISWDDGSTQLPAANREFVERLCKERDIKVPRIGLIYSGTPNAFSFGHIPSNARVVVTTGLLEVLTPEESNAVLAHEIGHVEHWDFVVMTIAALAPLLLYQIYVFTERINNAKVIAYTAYACYWVSQFIVLLLNRTREYYADHYSAEVTHEPNQLSSALIKIAYGMVRIDGEYQKVMKFGSSDEKSDMRKAQRWNGVLGMMGISNLHAGSALALSGANPTDAAAVMRWDLVNAWSRLYQLNSTHPLTALRVRALNSEAEAMNQVAEYPMPQDARIQWARFPLEFFIWAAPWIGGIAFLATFWYSRYIASLGLELSPHTPQYLLIFTGAAWMLRIWYRYHGEFQAAEIGTLIEDVEVSEMRPRAVRLKGEILGRGVPGAFWSPDLVMRDSSGMIFILYRQSIPFARFLFAITKAEDYIGQPVEIEGWFRRGLRPYVEMSRLSVVNGPTHRAYSRWVQYALAIASLLVGLWWLYA